MSERVVHILEAIEVEQRDRGWLLGAAAGQKPAELLLQRKPVGQAGELVVVGDALQLILGASALGDVLVGAHHAAHRAVWIVHWRASKADVDHPAVLAHALEMEIADRFAGKEALEQRRGIFGLRR